MADLGKTTAASAFKNPEARILAKDIKKKKEPSLVLFSEPDNSKPHEAEPKLRLSNSYKSSSTDCGEMQEFFLRRSSSSVEGELMDNPIHMQLLVPSSIDFQEENVLHFSEFTYSPTTAKDVAFFANPLTNQSTKKNEVDFLHGAGLHNLISSSSNDFTFEQSFACTSTEEFGGSFHKEQKQSGRSIEKTVTFDEMSIPPLDAKIPPVLPRPMDCSSTSTDVPDYDVRLQRDQVRGLPVEGVASSMTMDLDEEKKASVKDKGDEDAVPVMHNPLRSAKKNNKSASKGRLLSLQPLDANISVSLDVGEFSDLYRFLFNTNFI
jgi:hypothetical protein